MAVSALNGRLQEQLKLLRDYKISSHLAYRLALPRSRSDERAAKSIWHKIAK
ncbi:hypothetical protein [uncultured Helicobacter sp.]|uniref:hypothetical protein n=1 Tax=uncultured Helicobacter sp. TaxID=175537 RepID=UPI002594057E|nr:hypothetical protein [uncultured Helicobacter sp.]